jgi:hypothetical protein
MSKLNSLLSGLGTTVKPKPDTVVTPPPKTPTATPTKAPGNPKNSLTEKLASLGSPIQKMAIALESQYQLNLDDFKPEMECKHKSGFPQFRISRRTKNADGGVYIYSYSGDRYPVADLIPVKADPLLAIQTLTLQDKWSESDINDAVELIKSLLSDRAVEVNELGVSATEDRLDALKYLFWVVWKDYMDIIIPALPDDTCAAIVALKHRDINSDDPSIGDRFYLCAKPLHNWLIADAEQHKTKAKKQKHIEEFYAGFRAGYAVTVKGNVGALVEVCDRSGASRLVPKSLLSKEYKAYWEG